jgi:sarcosine oxidase subunit gamma
MRDATARPAAPMGMVTIRGDLGAIGPAVALATGCPIPDPRLSTMGDEDRLLWMSPDELLLLCPDGTSSGRVGSVTEALADAFATVADLSDARVAWDLLGPDAGEALATLTPADLTALAPTEVRRTRLAQIPAAFWAIDDGYRIVAFRSVEGYLRDLLANATGAVPAVQGG